MLLFFHDSKHSISWKGLLLATLALPMLSLEGYVTSAVCSHSIYVYVECIKCVLINANCRYMLRVVLTFHKAMKLPSSILRKQFNMWVCSVCMLLCTHFHVHLLSQNSIEGHIGLGLMYFMGMGFEKVISLWYYSCTFDVKTTLAYVHFTELWTSHEALW